MRHPILFVCLFWLVRDNNNLNSHKYVCITTYQPDTESSTVLESDRRSDRKALKN